MEDSVMAGLRIIKKRRMEGALETGSGNQKGVLETSTGPPPLVNATEETVPSSSSSSSSSSAPLSPSVEASKVAEPAETYSSEILASNVKKADDIRDWLLLLSGNAFIESDESIVKGGGDNDGNPAFSTFLILIQPTFSSASSLFSLYYEVEIKSDGIIQVNIIFFFISHFLIYSLFIDWMG